MGDAAGEADTFTTFRCTMGAAGAESAPPAQAVATTSIRDEQSNAPGRQEDGTRSPNRGSLVHPENGICQAEVTGQALRRLLPGPPSTNQFVQSECQMLVPLAAVIASVRR